MSKIFTFQTAQKVISKGFGRRFKNRKGIVKNFDAFQECVAKYTGLGFGPEMVSSAKIYYVSFPKVIYFCLYYFYQAF